MLAAVRTFAILGVEALPVAVEADVSRGLPGFAIVGLPDAAVRESRERVRSALSNCGFEFPLRRITANLAPADLRKAGPGFDLAIAAALLAASGQIPVASLERLALAGELALDGSIRPVPGALPMAEAARQAGLRGIAVAARAAPEAALADGVDVLPLERLEQLAALARGQWSPAPVAAPSTNGRGPALPDLADVRGQPSLRRALEVAAAGGHSMLVTGPPGAGKTLAARRLPSILPPLDREEALEVTRVASACGRAPPPGRLCERPFRAPHHTVSAAGLVGGGNPPRPGEVTLAHRGVLMLDELAEFSRRALEALRQPLEEGRVTITRAAHSVELPCRFQLVAAANPCPCGRGTEDEDCNCSPLEVKRYRTRLSGALADRIDIALAVEQPSAEALATGPGESSAVVRDRVAEARRRQGERLGAGRVNAELEPDALNPRGELDDEAREMLAAGHARLRLSGRGNHRVLRVARTIADLAGAERVGAAHVGEALTMRRRAPD